MAQKGIAEAGHPWEDQGRAAFSTKDGALFVDSFKKNQAWVGSTFIYFLFFCQRQLMWLYLEKYLENCLRNTLGLTSVLDLTKS